MPENTSPYRKDSGMDCAECGMHVEPAGAFHPWLYCWLRQRGVLNPEAFLRQNGFMPDPARWGENTAGSAFALDETPCPCCGHQTTMHLPPNSPDWPGCGQCTWDAVDAEDRPRQSGQGGGTDA